MSLQHVAQRLDTPRETPPIRLYVGRRRLDFIGTRALADVLGFTGKPKNRLISVYRWIARHGLRTYQESPRARVKVAAADVERILGAHSGESATALESSQLDVTKQE